MEQRLASDEEEFIPVQQMSGGPILQSVSGGGPVQQSVSGGAYIVGPDGGRDDHTMRNYSAYYCSATMGGQCSFKNGKGKCKRCGMTKEDKDKARKKAQAERG
mmetsp:Transcript_2677/g.7355  ORF Transcript_2677/g.7355 Transcript_2677/m.7355 type:complete len:103 (+) Transcript_2677:74-382(+)